VVDYHQRSLEKFDFDSILLPYNPIMMDNPAYTAGFNTLATDCEENNRAVQAIKTILNRPWKEGEQNRTTWYKPLEDQAQIDTMVHWALSRPGIFLNSVGDVDVLPKVLDAASRWNEESTQSDYEEAISKIQVEPLFT